MPMTCPLNGIIIKPDTSSIQCSHLHNIMSDSIFFIFSYVRQNNPDVDESTCFRTLRRILEITLEHLAPRPFVPLVHLGLKHH